MPLPISLKAAEVIAFHQALFLRDGWPKIAPQVFDGASAMHWIQTNHQFNSQLWDEEDLARRTKASDAEITANKRAIDKFNQARNDAVERIDEILLLSLGLVDAQSARTDSPIANVDAAARLHSETAGAMIDKLSIIALKIKAMQWQTTRTDVDASHLASSQSKLTQLLSQRNDLGACLDELLESCAAGTTYFKIYRQFKMYNDPRFNPALVAEGKR